jgi:hypothetical protein
MAGSHTTQGAHRPYDAHVRCTVCGHEQDCSFAWCLRHGWPRCCELTMRLDRYDTDIGAAVGEEVGCAPALISRLAAQA